MKQLIESQPVKVSPFVHMGYVAAPSLKKLHGPIFFSGIFLIVTFLIVYKIFKKRIEKSQKKILVAHMLIFIFVAFFLSSMFMGKSYPYRRKHGLTIYRQGNMYHKQSRYKDYLQEKGPGIYDVYDPLKFFESSRKSDEWGTLLKVNIGEDGNVIDVMSAGPDKIWDTEDDISYIKTTEREEAISEKRSVIDKQPLLERLKFMIKHDFYWGEG